jgi:hypothetical protein
MQLRTNDDRVRSATLLSCSRLEKGWRDSVGHRSRTPRRNDDPSGAGSNSDKQLRLCQDNEAPDPSACGLLNDLVATAILADL